MVEAVAIGSDHAGYGLKEDLKAFLDLKDIPYQDFGCFSPDSCDYPDVAVKVAKAVQDSGDNMQGVLVCGSGVGMAMTANRFTGVRAVVCPDIHTACLSRQHNNANVICLGGRMVAREYAREILESFLNTPFEGGRHQRRVEKMDTLLQGDQVQC